MSENENERLKHRLSKALRLAEKYKKETVLEQKVNVELANRIKKVKLEKEVLEKGLQCLYELIDKVDSSLHDMANRDVGENGSDNSNANLKDQMVQLQNSFQEFHKIRDGLILNQEKTTTFNSRIIYPKETSPFATGSDFSFINTPEGKIDYSSENCISSYEDDVSKFSASDLPDAFPTRESGYAINRVSSQMVEAAETFPTVSDITFDTMDPLHSSHALETERSHEKHSTTYHEPLLLSLSHQHDDESVPVAKSLGSVDVLEVHGFALNELKASSHDETNFFSSPLFEHFLVVGASVEAAMEASKQLSASEEDTLTNRFKRTIGVFLGSRKQNNNKSGQSIFPPSFDATPDNNASINPSSDILTNPIMESPSESVPTTHQESSPPKLPSNNFFSYFTNRKDVPNPLPPYSNESSAVSQKFKKNLSTKSEFNSHEFDKFVDTVEQNEIDEHEDRIRSNSHVPMMITTEKFEDLDEEKQRRLEIVEQKMKDLGGDGSYVQDNSSSMSISMSMSSSHDSMDPEGMGKSGNSFSNSLTNSKTLQVLSGLFFTNSSNMNSHGGMEENQLMMQSTDSMVKEGLEEDEIEINLSGEHELEPEGDGENLEGSKYEGANVSGSVSSDLSASSRKLLVNAGSQISKFGGALSRLAVAGTSTSSLLSVKSSNQFLHRGNDDRDSSFDGMDQSTPNKQSSSEAINTNSSVGKGIVTSPTIPSIVAGLGIPSTGIAIPNLFNRNRSSTVSTTDGLSHNNTLSFQPFANHRDEATDIQLVESTEAMKFSDSGDSQTPTNPNGVVVAYPIANSDTMNAKIAVSHESVVSDESKGILPTSISILDRKVGNIATDASILYRFPPSVAPPPIEVCDFCLPLGGKLSKLSNKEEDTRIQDILYGHSHSKRSSRCFIFLLEDKTIGGKGESEESGMSTGRLYGICVIHPRLLKLSNGTNETSNKSDYIASNSVEMMDPLTQTAAGDTTEFESSVCYAIITRFPLFDFFFQFIFDLITLERLQRMERAVNISMDSNLRHSKKIYEYLPRSILDSALGQLWSVPPPRYSQSIRFQLNSSLPVIERIRHMPSFNYSEHITNAAEWALPSLLSWMPVETLVWAVSLLMSEAKVIVVGMEIGMVSCAIMGLLVLLRPLDWVAPLITMLPHKLIDFIESPVPILAGLNVDSYSEKTMGVASLLNRCREEEDTILAVLDVTQREIFISASNWETARNLCIPGAEILVDRLQHCLTQEYSGARKSIVTNSVLGAPKQRTRPLYSVSPQQQEETRSAHDVMTKHISEVLEMALQLNLRLSNKDGGCPPLDPTLPEEENNNDVDETEDDEEDLEEDDDDENVPESSKALLEYYNRIIDDSIDQDASEGVQTRNPQRSSSESNAQNKLQQCSRTQTLPGNPIPLDRQSSKLSSSSHNPPGINYNNAEPMKLNKEQFHDVHPESFMTRFIFTQIFSEYLTAVNDETAASVDDNQNKPNAFNTDIHAVMEPMKSHEYATEEPMERIVTTERIGEYIKTTDPFIELTENVELTDQTASIEDTPNPSASPIRTISKRTLKSKSIFSQSSEEMLSTSLQSDSFSQVSNSLILDQSLVWKSRQGSIQRRSSMNYIRHEDQRYSTTLPFSKKLLQSTYSSNSMNAINSPTKSNSSVTFPPTTTLSDMTPQDTERSSSSS